MFATWHVQLAETITSATEILTGLDQTQSIFLCVTNLQWVENETKNICLYYKHDQSKAFTP